MSRKLIIAAVAAGVGALATFAPAAAQYVEVERSAPIIVEPRVSPPGYVGRRYVEQRYVPVIDRRIAPRIDDEDEECRIVIRQGVNRFGEYVERRARVCE